MHADISAGMTAAVGSWKTHSKYGTARTIKSRIPQASVTKDVFPMVSEGGRHFLVLSQCLMMSERMRIRLRSSSGDVDAKLPRFSWIIAGCTGLYPKQEEMEFYERGQTYFFTGTFRFSFLDPNKVS